MELQENQSKNYKSGSETGSTSGGAGNLKDGEKCVEITLDFGDDSAVVQNISADTARFIKGLKFVNKWNALCGWPEIERRFHQLATFGILSKSDFGKCIGMSDSRDFANELFDALARPRGITSASVLKDELREFWEQIIDPSFDVRLETFFDMVDKDGDGRITKEEVKRITKLSADANYLAVIRNHVDDYAALVMEELDPDNLGYIQINDLKRLLLTGPAKPSNIKMGLNNSVLRQSISMKIDQPEYAPIYRKLRYFVEDNWRQIWVVGIWVTICTCLFTWKFFQYKNRVIFKVMGNCITIATGAAETLKFNMALILLPVCRNTITWLRSNTKLGVLIPFDDNINFHKVIATGIIIGVSIHAGAHLTCDFPRLLHATSEEYKLIKPLFGDEQPNNYWWFLKGIKGWTGMVMVVLMAILFTLAHSAFRRNKLNNFPRDPKRFYGFNAFWHPFSLTSAPGDDYLSIHIRLLGDWTMKLNRILLPVQFRLITQDRIIKVGDEQPNNIHRMPRLEMDGPYCAPSQEYKDYEVVLLIGLGIGVSPMISILKDVIYDKRSKRKRMATQKACYFYWITREQASFEWFLGALNEVVENDSDGVIEIHSYCTSIYEEGDARSAWITMLQSLNHSKKGVDIVSGTKVKTHFSRPNWRHVFKGLAMDHVDQRIGVFYCGAPTLVPEIKKLSQEMSRKSTTKFDFHKENY